MAKTPAEFEQEFVATTKEKTGKTLDEWFAVIRSAGYTKQMEIVNWLKKRKRSKPFASPVNNKYVSQQW